ncbi:hypothetical protein JCM9803A_02610 [Rhodococcus erythropolis]
MALSKNMQTLTVRDLLRSDKEPTSVTTSATIGQVRAVSKKSGHLRILFRDNGIPLGILHVRDTLLQPDHIRAEDIMQSAFTLASDTPSTWHSPRCEKAATTWL